jgi:hypothetical protein
MNSYFLSISGFWWILVLLCVVAIGFSIFSYANTIPPITKSKKILLISLRSIALVILLFAIFEPIYTSINSSIIQPKLAVLLDNSESLAADDASGNRKNRYKNIIEKIDFADFDTNIVFYEFSSEAKQIKDFAFDSLKLNGNFTDISNAIRTINSVSENLNIRSILLLSDGAFNSGNNPIFDAENFAKPIYTIGIGDTIDPKDIAITSILTNEIAYIENPIPVSVNFNSVGFSNQELKITLLDNGQKIDEQIFNVNSERTNYLAIFEYNPKVEGIRKLTAKISKADNKNPEDEITEKNNSHSVYVKVLKNSRSIAIFAGSPSPDFAFIKRVLQNEKGVEIMEFVQKQGATFYQNPTKQQLNKADVIIFCGFPINSTPNNILSMINSELAKNKSFLFVAGLTTDYNKMKQIGEFLPFSVVSSRQQEFLVSPLINVNALSNPLLRVTGTDEDVNYWNQLPPIFKTETFVKIKPESEILSTMKMNNVELKEPLLITREFQDKKSVAIMGYGLYRWKMLGFASNSSINSNTKADNNLTEKTENPDLFEILIDNAYRWLSVNDKSKQMNVRTTKKSYNQGEKIEFIGELYDASYVAIDGANIKVEIGTGENKREIILNSIGNGRYYGSVEGLPKGDYNFSANAALGSRNLGNDNGRFNIGELSVEYQNLRQNSALLKSISERTNGKYIEENEIENLNKIIKSNNNFTEKPVTHQSEFHLWNWIWLLILSILLFATEWIIRKRTGLL